MTPLDSLGNSHMDGETIDCASFHKTVVFLSDLKDLKDLAINPGHVRPIGQSGR
jgi:hypothetical protein